MGRIRLENNQNNEAFLNPSEKEGLGRVVYNLFCLYE